MPHIDVPVDDFDAPDDHRWVAIVETCPTCDCCTKRLCEQALDHFDLCAEHLGEVGEGVRERVRECPCPRAEGTTYRRLLDLGEARHAGQITEEAYRRVLDPIMATHPIVGDQWPCPDRD